MLDDEEAIRHIFRVACGLDSMVLGEPQILGQLKDAFRHAQQADTLGSNLSRLFQHTFAVAKKIRTDTEIGASPVSVASAAVNLAQQFFAGFKKHTALAGRRRRDHRACRQAPRQHGHRPAVCREPQSRTRTGPGGQVWRLCRAVVRNRRHAARGRHSDYIDGSTEPSSLLEQMQQRSKRASASPFSPSTSRCRAISKPSAGELDDFYLYTIDDLDKVILEGQGNREAAAVEAHRLLDDEIRRYAAIERSKQVAPIIADLRESMKRIRKQVAKKARKRMRQG